MHRLPPDVIESFKRAYRADFGRDLTDAEAQEYGATVLDVLGACIKILVAQRDRRAAGFESCSVSDPTDAPASPSTHDDSLN